MNLQTQYQLNFEDHYVQQLRQQRKMCFFEQSHDETAIDSSQLILDQYLFIKSQLNKQLLQFDAKFTYKCQNADLQDYYEKLQAQIRDLQSENQQQIENFQEQTQIPSTIMIKDDQKLISKKIETDGDELDKLSKQYEDSYAVQMAAFMREREEIKQLNQIMLSESSQEELEEEGREAEEEILSEPAPPQSIPLQDYTPVFKKEDQIILDQRPVAIKVEQEKVEKLALVNSVVQTEEPVLAPIKQLNEGIQVEMQDENVKTKEYEMVSMDLPPAQQPPPKRSEPTPKTQVQQQIGKTNAQVTKIKTQLSQQRGDISFVHKSKSQPSYPPKDQKQQKMFLNQYITIGSQPAQPNYQSGREVVLPIVKPEQNNSDNSAFDDLDEYRYQAKLNSAMFGVCNEYYQTQQQMSQKQRNYIKAKLAAENQRLLKENVEKKYLFENREVLAQNMVNQLQRGKRSASVK